MYKITYHEDVVGKDMPKLDVAWSGKIRLAIETKLTDRPELYGKPLRKSLKSHFKLRVGDYRVIFRINGKTVEILAIMHRSVVYKRVDKRL